MRDGERRVVLMVDPYVRELIVAMLDGHPGIEAHAVADGDAALARVGCTAC